MKICVFTGTRADYGLLKSLISLINNDPEITLQIIVSGTHLSKNHGFTIDEIKRDGFNVDYEIDINIDDSSNVAICNSASIALRECSNAFTKLSPDIVVILGDRYEALSCAYSALLMRIPIAHISGGEITNGMIDDPIRHSITKMSSLHFVATNEYRRRVIQLGELPERVHYVGENGLDDILKLNYLSKSEIENLLGIVFKKKIYLITIHPDSNDVSQFRKQITCLWNVLTRDQDVTLIFTMANADRGGNVINNLLKQFVETDSRAYLFQSLGRLRYLSLMKISSAVIGNSSSGIVEAPSLKIPTINIGNRQNGRIKADSIIDCNYEEQKFSEALAKLNNTEFRETLKNVNNPYFKNGNSSGSILKHIKGTDLKILLPKSFYDLENVL